VVQLLRLGQVITRKNGRRSFTLPLLRKWPILSCSTVHVIYWQCLFCHQDASSNRLGRNEV